MEKAIKRVKENHIKTETLNLIVIDKGRRKAPSRPLYQHSDAYWVEIATSYYSTRDMESEGVFLHTITK